MKKLGYLLLIMIVFTCSACGLKYRGKDISYIEYSTIDYNGGYTNTQKIDFESNSVLEGKYLPGEETLELEEKYSFDEENEKTCIDALAKARFFRIKDEYKSIFPIIDGGGWTLVVMYTDGTSKVSQGSNSSPGTIFKKCDYAFFDLYGDDLFNTLPSTYTNPPAMHFWLDYTEEENHHYSTFLSLNATNYTWKKISRSDVDNFVNAKETEPFTFEEGHQYFLEIDNENSYVTRFKTCVIKSYDKDGNDEKVVLECGFRNSDEFALELNRIYVVTTTYDSGKCEYSFSTIIDDFSVTPVTFSFSIKIMNEGSTIEYDSSTNIVKKDEDSYELVLDPNELHDIYYYIRTNKFMKSNYVTYSSDDYNHELSISLYCTYKGIGKNTTFYGVKITDDMSCFGEDETFALLIQNFYNQYLKDIIENK